MPLSQGQAGWKRSPYFLPVLLVAELVLFGLFFLSPHSLLEVLTGVPLVVGLSWALVKVQASKQLNPSMKGRMWLLVLPLAAVAARLVLAILRWQ